MFLKIQNKEIRQWYFFQNLVKRPCCFYMDFLKKISDFFFQKTNYSKIVFKNPYKTNQNWIE